MTEMKSSTWRCTVCGFIIDDSSLPDTCPVCGAPSSAFERLEVEEASPASPDARDDVSEASASHDGPVQSWRCSVCGYIAEGDSPPQGCPVCGAQAGAFTKVGETQMPPPMTPRWQCISCEYIHESGEAPERCPSCGASSEAFGQISVVQEPRFARVADRDELPEGRVKTVNAHDRSFALTHFRGRQALLANACPHQGGPLGEGTIENGLLRCPWHGWQFHPTTGQSSAEGVSVETYPCKVFGDGVYVGLDLDEAPHVTTISDVMIRTMAKWGVTHVFGMVGHSNLGLADAIRRQEGRGKLTFIGVRHEGAASFAASAFAKLTGRPAACLSIAGPGATNLLTGLWDAKMDRVPILALTGQVDTQVLGPGAFQEADLASAFRPVATWSQTVLRESRHVELMTQALKHAVLQRDVGHLIFPNDVQTLPAAEGTTPGRPDGRLTLREIAPPMDSLEQAIELIEGSKRPVIIVGHGARFQMDPIVELAEKLRCPVITTFKGKGLISDDHPLACGVLGRSGTPIASYFMNESDLLVVFGASFSNHTGITPHRPTIQVDYDPLALGRFHAVQVPVYGEIGVTARLLVAEILDAEEGGWQDRREEIATRWSRWRTEKQSREGEDRGRGVNSAAIFAALSHTVPDDAVIAVDVGNNTYSFGRYFECSRQSVVMSGYLGSIGFGYPAAIGVWAAAPDRKIVAVTGDGGFGQYMGELCTAVKYEMNITHVLLNNNELGKISKEQRAARLKVWQTSLHNPNFAEFAGLCGALGVRVTSSADLEPALTQALAYDGPSLVEIMTDVDLV